MKPQRSENEWVSDWTQQFHSFQASNVVERTKLIYINYLSFTTCFDFWEELIKFMAHGLFLSNIRSVGLNFEWNMYGFESQWNEFLLTEFNILSKIPRLRKKLIVWFWFLSNNPSANKHNCSDLQVESTSHTRQNIFLINPN